MVYLERLIEQLLAHCAPPALSCRDSPFNNRGDVSTSCPAYARGGYCTRGPWCVVALEPLGIRERIVCKRRADDREVWPSRGRRARVAEGVYAGRSSRARAHGTAHKLSRRLDERLRPVAVRFEHVVVKGDLTRLVDAKVRAHERTREPRARRRLEPLHQLGRAVLDTDKLKALAAQLITGGGIVVAYLLAMASPPAGHEQCELSAVQAGMIQAAMAERNASCALNMTLASILDAGGA